VQFITLGHQIFGPKNVVSFRELSIWSVNTNLIAPCRYICNLYAYNMMDRNQVPLSSQEIPIHH